MTISIGEKAWMSAHVVSVVKIDTDIVLVCDTLGHETYVKLQSMSPASFIHAWAFVGHVFTTGWVVPCPD